MRQRKRLIRRRVNSNFRIEFGKQSITSYAGLEIFSRYFRVIRLNTILRQGFAGLGFSSDYGFVSLVRLLLSLLLVGGRRLRHVGFLQHDPMIQRMAQLRRLPSERTLSRWLKQLNAARVRALSAISTQLVVQEIRRLRLRLLTLDIDGTVISTGMLVSWALRGYNPHHRKVPSYFPLLAHIAETGHILRLKNRPGNVHDGKRAELFIEDVVRQVRRLLGKKIRLQFRMDAAFFQAPVIEALRRLDCHFAMKVPFWKWLGLKSIVQMRTRWTPVNDKVSCFETRLAVPQWHLKLRVVCYRKRVFHRTAKNFQLDLFSPDDGTYEYSAVATSMDLDPVDLWYFMAGRGGQEKTYAELKDGLAFDTVPTNHYGANSAWQLLSVIAHNLHRSLQGFVGAPMKQRTSKRTYRYRFTTIRTARFEWLNVAARLIRNATGTVLRLNDVPEVRKYYERSQAMLPRASGF
jgi:hypothetical protein